MAPHDITTVTATAKANSLSKTVSPRRCAYVTFLAGNGDYVKGVVGLAKGLRKVNSKYPLVVAILPDVPEEHRKMLTNQGCVLREIEPVYPPENLTQFAKAYYVINYSKLRIWEFVEYSKMIYLDGEIQVFENIDHLFEKPDGYLYAVMDCFCEKTWSHNPQFKNGYCPLNWPAELGNTPDPYFNAFKAYPNDSSDIKTTPTTASAEQFVKNRDMIYSNAVRGVKPTLSEAEPPLFNAGMFVYNPCIESYNSLLKTLETLETSDTTLFAEQDFLNMFFRNIYKPIPPIYNLVLAMLWRHPENIELEKAKVVHYCAAGSKPWRYTGEEQNMQREDIKMLIQKWSDIYNDESLDYKNYSAVDAGEEAAGNEAGEDGDAGLQHFLVALSVGGEVPYISAPSAA